MSKFVIDLDLLNDLIMIVRKSSHSPFNWEDITSLLNKLDTGVKSLELVLKEHGVTPITENPQVLQPVNNSTISQKPDVSEKKTNVSNTACEAD